MSKHWNPNEELARTAWEGFAPATRRKLPPGGLAGLLVVAAGCAGTIALLYHLAGPRDIFAP